MRQILSTTCILTGVLLAGGCATKKYVRSTVSPVQARVDQVGEQTTKNGAAIEENRKEIHQVDETAQNGVSSAKEMAKSADGRASEAMSKATQAGDAAAEARGMADKNGRELGNLRQAVSSLDDYKVKGEATVNFGFGQYKLTPEGMQQLDELAAQKSQVKRYFIGVEGYTDKTGPVEFNAELSRRRAESVVQYLVTKHDIPIYRIQMIGLGPERPVDEGKTRASRAKNRRVEVKLFSADESPTLSSSAHLQ